MYEKHLNGVRFSISKNKILFILFLVIYISLLFWTAKSSNNIVQSTDKPVDYYNFLTEAFQNHQTFFINKPAKQLLNLKNPYNPESNAPYRYHDVSLYNGKYYLYFGPAPVVTLLLPYHLLTQKYLSVSIAVVIFVALSYIFTVLTFRSVLQYSNIRVNGFHCLIFISVLAFSNKYLLMLRWPNLYELAIACGAAYTSCGIYFYVRHLINLDNNKLGTRNAVLSFLFLGLAASARPNLVIFPIILSFSLFVKYFIHFNMINIKIFKNLISSLHHVLVILIPFILIIMGIFYYNYTRFNNILEFGNTYQLTGDNYLKNHLVVDLNNINHVIDTTKKPLFHIDGLYDNFRSYLLSPIGFQKYFPFISISSAIGDFTFYTSHAQPFGIEPVFGILYLFPLYITSLVLLFYYYLKDLNKSKLIKIILPIGLATLVCMLFDSCFGGRTDRYTCDFTGPLSFTSCVAIYFLLLNIKNYFIKIISYLVLVLCTIWCILSVFLLSISSYGDRGLQYQNPDTFKSLASIFNDDTLIKKQVRYLYFNFNFKITNSIGISPITILGSGDRTLRDNVILQNIGDNRYIIEYKKTSDFRDAQSYYSPFDVFSACIWNGSNSKDSVLRLDLDKNKTYSCEIIYNQMVGSLRLRLNGNDVLITNTQFSPSNEAMVNLINQTDILNTINKNIDIFNIHYDLQFAEAGYWFPRI